MEDYGREGRCLMESLRIELDDAGTEPCGRCSICTEPKFDDEVDRTLALQALDMLRARPIEIEPRRSTPTAVGGFRKIPRDEQLEPGRVLCHLNDPGWGRLVRKGKWEDEHFGDELVEAAAALFKNWNPQPAPTWVTAVPSLRHPELVPHFAERLAKAIGLPYSQALKVVKKTKEQSTLENSRQQYLNVQGSLGMDHDSAFPGSVLLVDDLADSKWTLHEAGGSLRRAGTSAVVPLVIASSGSAS